MLLHLPRAGPVPQQNQKTDDFMLWRHAWCHDAMSWRHDVILWRHDVIPWCHITSQCHTMMQKLKTHHITIFDLVTLTFDLWPWPSNLSGILSRSIPVSNFVTVRQSVQPWECPETDRQTHTHRHTKRLRFYNLRPRRFADAAGDNVVFVAKHSMRVSCPFTEKE